MQQNLACKFDFNIFTLNLINSVYTNKTKIGIKQG